MSLQIELETIAESLGRVMAKANNEPEPQLAISEGSSLVARAALAGTTVHFICGTLYGYDVHVTVSRAGGMFAE